MATHRSNYLIDQLINNRLSEAELDEFLAGLHHDDTLKSYSDHLEIYFNNLLNQNEPSIAKPEPQVTPNS